MPENDAAPADGRSTGNQGTTIDRPEGSAQEAGSASANGHAGPYATAAQILWRKGWRGVLPLPAREKEEPPSGWTGWTGGWPSWPDVQTWLDDPRHRNANIGIRLPEGVVGLDVDCYDGKPGRATLLGLETDLGPLPPTWMLTSRADGSCIRLMRVPAGSTFVGGLPGIELIQHYHRYAVGPGSIHPEGRVYRTFGPDGEPVALPHFPRPEELPELPLAWRDRLHRKAGGNGAKVEIDGTVREWLEGRLGADGPPCSGMLTAIANATGTIPEGSRYDTMVRDQLRIVRLAEQGHAGLMTALERHRDHYVASVGAARSAGKATAEYMRALDGAPGQIAKERTWPPPKVDPCPLVGSPAPEQPVASTASSDGQKGGDAQPAARRVELVPLDAFLAVEDKPIRFRIDRLLPVDGRALVAAQAKAGKSTLVANLIRALVDGEPFLGEFQTMPITGTVVLIDDELSEPQLRYWLREQGIVNVDRVHVISLRGRVSLFNLTDPTLFEDWRRVLAEVGCAVLIFDCLRPALVAAGLNEDKDPDVFLNLLSALQRDADIGELVIAHHMGHAGERSRGASVLRDWPEAEWKIVRPPRLEEGKEVDDLAGPRFFSAYGRDVEVGEGQLVHDPITRRLTYSRGGNRRQARVDSLSTRVLEYVRDHPNGSKSSAEKQITGNTNDVRDAISWAVENGLVSEGNKGKLGVAHPLNLTQDGHAKVATSLTSLKLADDLGANTPVDLAPRLRDEGGTGVPIDVAENSPTSLRSEPALIQMCSGCGQAVAEPDSDFCWKCG